MNHVKHLNFDRNMVMAKKKQERDLNPTITSKEMVDIMQRVVNKYGDVPVFGEWACCFSFMLNHVIYNKKGKFIRIIDCKEDDLKLLDDEVLVEGIVWSNE